MTTPVDYLLAEIRTVLPRVTTPFTRADRADRVYEGCVFTQVVASAADSGGEMTFEDSRCNEVKNLVFRGAPGVVHSRGADSPTPCCTPARHGRSRYICASKRWAKRSKVSPTSYSSTRQAAKQPRTQGPEASPHPRNHRTVGVWGLGPQADMRRVPRPRFLRTGDSRTRSGDRI